jgi:Phage capsid family
MNQAQSPKAFRRPGDGARSLYRACIAVHQRMRPHPWQEDHVVDAIIRAPQSPTMTTDVGADALVTVIEEFADALVPSSAAAALFQLADSMNFDRAGQISVLGVSDLPLATWVREGAPIPVVMGLSSLVTLAPYKLASIIPLTNEMMRSSNAEAIMRRALINIIGPSLDATLFDANPAVPGLRPAGLLNGVPALGADVGTNTEAMIQDMQSLVSALAAYGGNGSIAFIASPSQAVRLKEVKAGGTTFPVLISGQTTALIAIATAALAVAMGVPSIDVSSEAVFHMDDTPLPISGDTGVMPPGVRSAWQTDSAGLKLRLPVSWGLAAPAVAWLEPNWA